MRYSIALASLLPTLLASPLTTTETEDPLPLLIWHGLGDNYAADGLHSVGDLAEEINPGTFVYYIHLDTDPSSDKTATFLGNLTEQISQVCADIAAHPILSTAPALNALGFSQGGQFLRAYVERCHDPPVRNLVTFGSQHDGIAKYQMCGSSDWLCKAYIGLLKANTWGSWVQSHLVPAQYFKSVDEETGLPTDDYLTYSNFLADINNERALKNATYKKNLARLEKFVMFLFEDDTTVVPKESGWFAYVNGTDGEVTGVRNRTLYKEDWIGLRELVFRTTEGGHMQLGDEVLTDVFEKYFAPGKAKGVVEMMAHVVEDVIEDVQEIIEL
jgi:palmitoyl-protein thioesterase